MTISNQPSSLLDSVLKAQANRADYGVAVLKKAQDAETQQGQAVIDMLEQAGAPAANPPSSDSRLDTYA